MDRELILNGMFWGFGIGSALIAILVYILV